MKPYRTTKEGFENLKKELNELKSIRRPEISERIAQAKELGDLSENAEYHDAKEALAFLEGRIMELEELVSRAEVVEPGDTDEVSLGCTVVCDADGRERTYRLVGSNEADPSSGKISSESPLGRALIGKRAGESFEFEAPSGTVPYRVKDVRCE
jgi:transcription elongation factor GreA